MFGAALVPAALQCTLMTLCPESPTWLLHMRRPADAVDALRRLHGTRLRLSDYPKLEAAYVGPLQEVPAAATVDGGGPEQPLLAAEHGVLSSIAEREEEQGQGAALGWSALWEPRYRRVMILAVALPIAQQASGINTVIFYSSQVRSRLGQMLLGWQLLPLSYPLPSYAAGADSPPCLGHWPLPLPRCHTHKLFTVQVFEQAGLRSPILGSIAMGLANLGGCLLAGLGKGGNTLVQGMHCLHYWPAAAAAAAQPDPPLRGAGASAANPSIHTSPLARPPVAFTIVAAFLMDRAGRRALLLTSFVGMAACLATLSGFMLLPSELIWGLAAVRW